MKKIIITSTVLLVVLTTNIVKGISSYGYSTNEKENILFSLSSSSLDLVYRISLAKFARYLKDKNYFKKEEKEEIIRRAIEAGMAGGILWGLDETMNKVYIKGRNYIKNSRELPLVGLSHHLFKYSGEDGRMWAVRIFRALLSPEGQQQNVPGWWWPSYTFRVIINNLCSEIILRIPSGLREELSGDVTLFLKAAKKKNYPTRRKLMVHKKTGERLKTLRELVDEIQAQEGFGQVTDGGDR